MNKHVKRICGEERAWVDVVGRYLLEGWRCGISLCDMPGKHGSIYFGPDAMVRLVFRVIILGKSRTGMSCISRKEGDEANRIAARPDKLYLSATTGNGRRSTFHFGWFGNFFY
jgi:hypothetical protein